LHLIFFGFPWEISIARPTTHRTLEALAIPDSMLTALMTRLAGVCGVHLNQRNTSRESLIAKELLKLVEGPTIDFSSMVFS